jgi:hypothetical protein
VSTAGSCTRDSWEHHWGTSLDCRWGEVSWDLLGPALGHTRRSTRTLGDELGELWDLTWACTGRSTRIDSRPTLGPTLGDARETALGNLGSVLGNALGPVVLQVPHSGLHWVYTRRSTRGRLGEKQDQR